MLALALTLLACDDSPPPTAEPSGEPAAEPTAEPTAEPASEPTLPPRPMPAGVPHTGETIALLGHGIRLTLNPPFQVAWMGSAGADGALVVAWWDVSALNAGRDGRSGLYNVAIHKAPVPEGEPGIITGTAQRRGRDVRTLQLGETGTALWLPQGHSTLGGLGEVSPGPADPVWRLQIGAAEPIPWPDTPEMLHSWDPADGGPVKFLKRPVRPWGPWVEAPAEAPPVP